MAETMASLGGTFHVPIIHYVPSCILKCISNEINICLKVTMLILCFEI